VIQYQEAALVHAHTQVLALDLNLRVRDRDRDQDQNLDLYHNHLQDTKIKKDQPERIDQWGKSLCNEKINLSKIVVAEVEVDQMTKKKREVQKEV